MSSDFEAYEQDFGTLTAEVTNKIGRIPKLSGEEKTQLVLNVDKQLEEVRELLEQMDLEVREIPIQSRAMYNSRLKSYKQEMEKLEKDFKRSRIAYSDEVRNELLGDDASSSENQLIKLREERAHLLDNTEKLERSSRRLEAGYQIAVETGTYSVLGLGRDGVGRGFKIVLGMSERQQIVLLICELRETDANLGKSSRILTGMLRRLYAYSCMLGSVPCVARQDMHALCHEELLFGCIAARAVSASLLWVFIASPWMFG
ncbi:vesicle transport through interaction with t-SNAREs homolog 1A [Diretmus argenteus]